MVSTTSSGRKRKRSFAIDVDVMEWLERVAPERRTTPNALVNLILAAAMEAELPREGEAA
jgi:hypothetical protein